MSDWTTITTPFIGEIIEPEGTFYYLFKKRCSTSDPEHIPFDCAVLQRPENSKTIHTDVDIDRIRVIEKESIEFTTLILGFNLAE